VVAADRKPAHQLPEEALRLSTLGVTLALGLHPSALSTRPTSWSSPGVPWDLAELSAARDRGVPVLAELELGARFILGGIAP
jgi:UDP-N-acetylmuramoylalanine-D-glutamate ligase